MRRIFLVPLLIVVGLSLSGCVIGDGIAQVVKKTRDQFRDDGQASAQSTAPSQASSERAEAPRDENPPPAPASAPSRSSVSVESLPPPK